ncbi:hypothetical protein BpHYR1_025385 [Brachionus plicatilis]|uniref:Uncharacterized protein n=1 Tax=Brachionus plicatilis TaxID=10195 RepID=A0A3M7PLT9_BRAPC|nr:hypothetical protein BpHYR1_025385 [Brachionus plicatilis]
MINWHVPSRIIQKIRFVQLPRRHDFTLERQLVKNCEQRFNFFRVVNVWNRLERVVINSDTL